MEIFFFLFQGVAALIDSMRSKWRYVAAFLLTDLLLVLAMLVDAIYSSSFHDHMKNIIFLFTTLKGLGMLLGVGFAGMIGVRVLIALKI